MILKLYTDGSTRGNGKDSGGQGAWGFLAIEDGSILHKEAAGVLNTTNQQCELMAIINACRWAANEYPDHDKIIYSDSAYAINCYTDKWYVKWEGNGWTSSNKQAVKNQKLWRELIPYFKDEHFTFKKVRGHADDKYNNIIDELVQSITLSMVKK